MDYAKHTDRKGRIKDVDEFNTAQQLDRMVAERYASDRRDVESLLRMLREEVAAHAGRVAKAPTEYSLPQDVGKLRGMLVQALAFLAKRDAADINAEPRPEKPSHEERR